MGGEGEGPPPLYQPKDDHWTHFDNSVNAVSFGFIATAILVSMFLLMAIFEKFLRTTSPERRRRSVIEAQNHVAAFSAKLGYYPSHKATEVSVVMPGEKVPTFIAQPAPAPCPPERGSWPLHNPDVPIPD
ncbi:hypothetical protein SASPL_152365 [Salvia splendens]|uniref:Uncharacterized protein n=1 Tax=Salvia splendens TaxID=180675 RepID=A0A4D8ZP11_SALSN|nr:uncharacterized protein LOC121783980 [Salvia splendens]XP_042038101.1 uncharacterized protein LOC121783987 [Salvia splendens]KAG6387169.1 hypothetical protein SASPL_152355 [Salvia splendens]KAG6387179.1 hypothetical protein SASPL_152365 [Salvia splendens]